MPSCRTVEEEVGDGKKSLASLRGLGTSQLPVFSWMAFALCQRPIESVLELDHDVPDSLKWCNAVYIQMFADEGRGSSMISFSMSHWCAVTQLSLVCRTSKSWCNNTLRCLIIIVSVWFSAPFYCNQMHEFNSARVYEELFVKNKGQCEIYPPISLAELRPQRTVSTTQKP